MHSVLYAIRHRNAVAVLREARRLVLNGVLSPYELRVGGVDALARVCSVTDERMSDVHDDRGLLSHSLWEYVPGRAVVCVVIANKQMRAPRDETKYSGPHPCQACSAVIPSAQDFVAEIIRLLRWLSGVELLDKLTQIDRCS